MKHMAKSLPLIVFSLTLSFYPASMGASEIHDEEIATGCFEERAPKGKRSKEKKEWQPCGEPIG